MHLPGRAGMHAVFSIALEQRKKDTLRILLSWERRELGMHKVGCHPGSHNAAYRPLPRPVYIGYGRPDSFLHIQHPGFNGNLLLK